MDRRVQALLGGLLALLAANGAAQTRTTLPEALEDWRDWVLEPRTERLCPLPATGQEGRICAWPGRFLLEVDAQGLTFSGSYRVYARTWVALPGDATLMPEELRVDGQARPVLLRNGVPSVELEPGNARIGGSIRWRQRPESLPLPPSIGLLELRLDGVRIEPLERSEQSLWLGRARQQPEADALRLTVFRRIRDGVPLLLDTRVQFQVSGSAREARVGPLWTPPDFAPVALESSLNARLDPQGYAVMQLRAGVHELTLTARATGVFERLAAPGAAEPWPSEEVWSFAGATELRTVDVRGPGAIDPGQAGVPQEWRELPTWILRPGEVLELVQTSRGISQSDANRLRLERRLWLDFDGRGWTASDRLSGRMLRGFRLDLGAPWELTRAELGGETLLVTELDGRRGVEVRAVDLELHAGARAPADTRLPLSGWNETLEGAEITLELPPGHLLLAARGVDRALGAWIERWTLLDVFAVLIVAILAWRLGAWTLALPVLAYLLLSYTFDWAPVWSLALVYVVLLAARSLPTEHRLRRWLHGVGWLALAVVVALAVPFAFDQARLALHPQLERERIGLNEFERGSGPRYAATPSPAADTVEDGFAGSEEKSFVPAQEAVQALDNVLTGARAPNQRYQAGAVLQAGNAQPEWTWFSHRLSVSGPITPEQELALYIAPPWAMRLWRLLAVLGLGALIVDAIRRLVAERSAATTRSGPTAVALAVVLVSPGLGATTPDPELLDELARRLDPPASCAPECSRLASADLRLDGRRLSMLLEAHVGARSEVALPWNPQALALEALRVDGLEHDPARRGPGGALWIPLERGVRAIAIEARVLHEDDFALNFPQRPARVSVTSRGWTSAGLRDDRLLTNALEFAPLRLDSTPNPDGTGRSALRVPPFVAIERRLDLDLDWTVTTTVRRIAPPDGGISVRIPLIQGEQLTSGQYTVEDGAVLVNLQPGQDHARYTADLARSERLTLTAADLERWSETWVVAPAPIWRAEVSGVPPSRADWIQSYHPLPGESLRIDIRRPEAVAGGTRVIDGVNLSTHVGHRARESRLGFRLRATQGGQHVLRLPSDAEVLSLVVDGAALNIRPEAGVLSFPVAPGDQSVELRFRQAEPIRRRLLLPQLDLGAEASNLQLRLELPQDRWLLAADGPRLGPAVLYWSALVVLLLIALALARIPGSPVPRGHWVLLVLGFSASSWLALAVIVLWLYAIEARRRHGARWPDLGFNLAQIGLAAFTLVAVATLIAAIPYGLLGTPDMLVQGNQSSAHELRWFADRSSGPIPSAGAWTISVWWYRALMLLFALWLAQAALRWLAAAWSAFRTDGLWRRKPPAPEPIAKPERPAPPPLPNAE